MIPTRNNEAAPRTQGWICRLCNEDETPFNLKGTNAMMYHARTVHNIPPGETETFIKASWWRNLTEHADDPDLMALVSTTSSVGANTRVGAVQGLVSPTDRNSTTSMVHLPPASPSHTQQANINSTLPQQGYVQRSGQPASTATSKSNDNDKPKVSIDIRRFTEVNCDHCRQNGENCFLVHFGRPCLACQRRAEDCKVNEVSVLDHWEQYGRTHPDKKLDMQMAEELLAGDELQVAKDVLGDDSLPFLYPY